VLFLKRTVLKSFNNCFILKIIREFIQVNKDALKVGKRYVFYVTTAKF